MNEKYWDEKARMLYHYRYAEKDVINILKQIAKDQREACETEIKAILLLPSGATIGELIEAVRTAEIEK